MLFSLAGWSLEKGGETQSAIQSWPLWDFTDELCGADNRVNYLSSTSLSLYLSLYLPPSLFLSFFITVASSSLCVAVREVMTRITHCFSHIVEFFFIIIISAVLAPLSLTSPAFRFCSTTGRTTIVQPSPSKLSSHSHGEPNPRKTRPQQPPRFPINTAWVTEQKCLRKSIFKAIDSLMNVKAWGQRTEREPSLWATV